ncbi:MAG: hypothetical protein LC096_04400 [Bacteroidia bacterium]|nr:hypothetical protein [Bacteroidia bacterium]
MKKLIAIVAAVTALFISANNVNAQKGKPTVITKVGDTLKSGKDTVYITIINALDKLKSVEINISKVSGTVAGSAVLQRSNGSNVWYTFSDTLTLSDIALQGKFWTVSPNIAASIRVRIIRSNGVGVPTIHYLRREEE